MNAWNIAAAYASFLRIGIRAEIEEESMPVVRGSKLILAALTAAAMLVSVGEASASRSYYERGANHSSGRHLSMLRHHMMMRHHLRRHGPMGMHGRM